MADIKKLFGTNKQKESEGTFVSIGNGIEVKVKRAGTANKDFTFAQAKMLRPYSKQIQAGTVDPADLTAINIKLFADHVVTDWRGIEVDGKELPFSKKAFVELSKEMPDFFSEVFNAAYEMQNFKDAEDDELLGKPESSTDTD